MGKLGFRNTSNIIVNDGLSKLNPKTLARPETKYGNLFIFITCKFSLYYIFIQNVNGPGELSRYIGATDWRSGDVFVGRKRWTASVI
jgi:hypothetical protein